MSEFSDIFEQIFKKVKSDKNLIYNISLLSNLQKIFDDMPENKKNAELIMALKPLLSDDLKQKADEAVKMLKIFSIIPDLKDVGILN